MDIYANNTILVSQEQQLLARLQALISEIADRLMEVSKDKPSIEAASSPVSITDAEDIGLSLNGDGNAYKRIIERYQDHVSRIMWKFSRNERTHEELVQDVFVQAYLSLSSFKSKSPLANWLARIATRVGYTYWKQNKSKHKGERFSLEDWDKIADTSVDTGPSEAAELLHRLLKKLGVRDRLVITLRYLQQCSVAETVERTGWSPTMVKVQSFRAKNKLKKLFQKYGKDIEL
jgi:RNA polymerase sigma-70 factor (ECF subfamily)